MHTYASRRLPGFAPIARGQLWFFVSTLLRAWPIVLIAIAFVAFAVQAGSEEPDARLFISGMLALFLAFAAWPQQKTAGGLAYFRSLPPSHSRNAAVRAGVFWVVLIGLSLVSFILIESGSDLGGRLTSVLVRESGYDGAIPFPVSGPALVGATFTFLILAAGLRPHGFRAYGFSRSCGDCCCGGISKIGPRTAPFAPCLTGDTA